MKCQPLAGGWGALVASLVLCVVLAGLLLAPSWQTSAPGRWIFSAAARQPSDSNTSQPSVAVITFNLLGQSTLHISKNASDIRVAGGYYWAYFLLASRLYNPRLPLLAIVNKYEAVRNTTVVWGALEAAGVQLVPLERLSRRGSRWARMMERAPDFLDSYYAFMNATGPKIQRKCWGKGRSDGGCRNYYEYRMRMNARFCAQADLANEMGVDYVVAMDADILLVQDLLEAMWPLMKETQMLTFCEWSSQMVFFKRGALDDFCNAMLDVTQMPQQEQWQAFKAGQYLIEQDEWTDMPYLAAFSRFIRPDLSHTILCGTPASINRPLCPRLQYMLGVGASFIPISENPPSVDNNCSRLAEFVEWRDAGGSSAARGDGSNSTRLLRSLLTNSTQAGGKNSSNTQHQQLPQLWTRWRYYPSKRGEGERAPLIHFQGECKHAGVQQVRRLFVESGLVPDLEAAA